MPVLQDCVAHPGLFSSEVTKTMPPYVHLLPQHCAWLKSTFPVLVVYVHVYYNNIPTDGSLEP